MPGPDTSRINITLQQPDGQTYVVDDNHLMRDLQQNGANPTGISADGLTMTFQDDKGQYQVPLENVLKQMGHQNFHIEPSQPNEEHVNPMWRAAINNLSDDDAKKSFLEAKLRREGIDKPQVVGKGRDWYAYHPSMGQWLSLTNSKDWDLSDLAEGAQDVAHGVGSAVGGALGGGAGFFGGAGAGSIPGAMLGSALGGGVVDAGTQAALAALDPDYRDVYGQHAGSQLAHTAGSATVDALGAGAFGAGAKYGGQALRGLLQTGPATTIARGASSLGQMGSSGAAQAAKALDNPVGQNVVASLLPGTGQLQMLAGSMELPAELVTGVPKLFGKAAETTAAEEALGKTGAFGVRRGVEDVLTKRPVTNVGGKVGSFFRGGPKGTPELATEEAMPTARDVLGNVTEKTMRGLSSDSSAVARETYRQAIDAGMSQDAARKAARQALEEGMAATSARNRAVTGVAENVGQGIENLRKVGSALNKGTTSAVSGGLKVARGLGEAGDVGFGLAKNASMAAQPIENYLYANKLLHAGADTAQDDFSSWLKNRQKAKIFGNANMTASTDY